jgi:rhodanese-related sulfurtransferase
MLPVFTPEQSREPRMTTSGPVETDASSPVERPPLPLEIDVEAVADLQRSEEAFLLLDCREPDEHAIARLPGAVLVPMGEIPERLQELEAYRSGRVVVHCHHGGRSLRVTRFLREKGFQAAQNMVGGIESWSLRIDPSVPRY